MIMTPVQLFRNISAFSADTNTSEPSQELCSAVRAMMAQNNFSLPSERTLESKLNVAQQGRHVDQRTGSAW